MSVAKFTPVKNKVDDVLVEKLKMLLEWAEEGKITEVVMCCRIIEEDEIYSYVSYEDVRGVVGSLEYMKHKAILGTGGK